MLLAFRKRLCVFQEEAKVLSLDGSANQGPRDRLHLVSGGDPPTGELVKFPFIRGRHLFSEASNEPAGVGRTPSAEPKNIILPFFGEA